MKKGLALLLALVLAAGLLGCGSAAGEDSRLTLARKALPDEPELTLAGIANLGDVCLIWCRPAAERSCCGAIRWSFR